MVTGRAASRARIVALVSCVALKGCVGTPSHKALTAGAPVFEPAHFFTGRSEGRGVLRKVFAKPNPFAVHGEGRIGADGEIVLVQRVEPTTGKASIRTWHLHEIAPGRWRGSLSSATSPIVGVVHGNEFHLRYTIKGGYRAEQWMFLQPDGTTVLNRMVVTKFGAPVGRIEETIRRVD